MDQDDDIMAGTFADDPATSTSAAPTAGPGSPTSASTAASHELAASTSVSAGPPSAAVAAVSTDNSGAPIGSGSDGLSRQDSGGPAQPPKQTEAQKREERRKKSLGLDEKKRGRRLFGGLLGTLDAFKKEERQRDASDAAKRREQIASRIQTKLRTETVVAGELATKEKALRPARNELERLEAELRTKRSAWQTRHETMRRLSGFLFTPIAASTAPAAEGSAIRGSASVAKAIFDLPSPIPLGQAARFHAVPCLFYLPKLLTNEQDERLAKQKLEVDDLILREEAEWAASRAAIEAAVTEAKEKLAGLTSEVQELRTQKASFTPTPISTPTAPAAQSSRSSAGNNADGWGEPAGQPASRVKDEEMREVDEPSATVKADDGWGQTPAVTAVPTGVDGEEVEY